MNLEKLFGVKTSSLSVYYLELLKNIILFKNGIGSATEIKLLSNLSPVVEGLELVSNMDGKEIDSGLVVGTIRMGYGHHRMAYSLYTHSLERGIRTSLHDILAIDCKEAKAIKEIDGLYSYWSRLSSEMGGVTEWLWGQLTSQGNINSLYFSTMLAEQYKNLADGINKELPYISSYPLNGQVAVAAGFQKVWNLVPDNFPQYYVLVPQAMNLVQSPASYIKFINMGIPKENLVVAGHWVSEPILSNLEQDTAHRLNRLSQNKKRRFLLPIGGAGAQKGYLFELLEGIADPLKKEAYSLFINTGDHIQVFEETKEHLTKLGIPYKTIESYSALLDYCNANAFSKDTETDSVVILSFKDYFPAFIATDLLIRISDVLITKPSELAFFPVPKIFIRRVGDHEAASAFRSMELGEGTIECREVEHAKEMIDLFSSSTDIMARMNECILRNHREQIYSGSKTAIDLALA